MVLINKLFKGMLAAAFASSAWAGKTTSVSDWGNNPSKLPAMLVYTPDKIADKPAIIVALGFVLLYPTSNAQQGMNCWDANTAKSLTHNGGGDSEGIAAMAGWALKTYGGDPEKGFVVGDSSGAMESNAMAATYPEVFAGAASYSGVPAGCWAGSPISTPMSSDLSCPLGKKASTYTKKQWGDLARNCSPDYNSTARRLKMMIVHGTADTAVVISLLKAQMDQWSDVLGLSFTKNVSNDPIPNWKKIVYGDGTQLVGYEVAGGGHMPPFQGETTLKFFGLM